MKIERETPLDIRSLSDDFDSHLDGDVFVRGRISSVRKMKDFIFADIWERGFKIQVVFIADQSFAFNSGDLLSISGRCFLTKSGERSIEAKAAEMIGKWESEVGYKDVSKSQSGALSAFEPEAYLSLFFPNLLRNNIRSFLNFESFFEVQTPILGDNYNGGRSFPVTSSYLGKNLGYNRTTMEERMQALIGAGFEKIYQIGSVFRSERESTFLEGYATNMSWDKGKILVRKMLSSVVSSLIKNGAGRPKKAWRLKSA